MTLFSNAKALGSFCVAGPRKMEGQILLYLYMPTWNTLLSKQLEAATRSNTMPNKCTMDHSSSIYSAFLKKDWNISNVSLDSIQLVWSPFVWGIQIKDRKHDHIHHHNKRLWARKKQTTHPLVIIKVSQKMFIHLELAIQVKSVYLERKQAF